MLHPTVRICQKINGSPQKTFNFVFVPQKLSLLIKHLLPFCLPNGISLLEYACRIAHSRLLEIAPFSFLVTHLEMEKLARHHIGFSRQLPRCVKTWFWFILIQHICKNGRFWRRILVLNLEFAFSSCAHVYICWFWCFKFF